MESLKFRTNHLKYVFVVLAHLLFLFGLALRMTLPVCDRIATSPKPSSYYMLPTTLQRTTMNNSLGERNEQKHCSSVSSAYNMLSNSNSLPTRRRPYRRRRVQQGEWLNCECTKDSSYEMQERPSKEGESHGYNCHQQQAERQSWNLVSLPTVSMTPFVYSSLLSILILFAPSICAQPAPDSATTTTWTGSINATINPSSKHITYWQRDIVGTGGTIDLSNLDISLIPREQDNREFQASKVRKMRLCRPCIFDFDHISHSFLLKINITFEWKVGSSCVPYSPRMSTDGWMWTNLVEFWSWCNGG